MKKFLAFSAAFIVLLANQSAQAANDTWSGAAGDGLWATPGNWNALPGSADTAIFNNSTSTTISLGGAAQSVTSLNFTTSVGSFTFNTGGAGGQFDLTSGGNISLLAAATGTGLTETFNAPLSLGGNYTFTNARADTTSSLVFAGNITNSATSTLTISGAGTGTGNQINGAISNGTGTQSVNITTTAGTWTLGGANSYSGTTTINGSGGTTIISGTNSSAGAITLTTGILELDNSNNGGLASGTLTLGGGTLQSLLASQGLSNNVVLSASSTVSGADAITVNGSFTNSGGNRTLTSSDTGGLTLAGNVYLSEASGTGRTLTLTGADKTLISGVISNFNGSGTAGSLTLNTTAGVVTTLSNANTYSGGTTLTQGTLVLGQSSLITSGVLTSGALGTGTLAINGTTNGAVDDNGTAITVANSITTSGATNFGTTGGGSLTFDGTTLTTPATFTLLANSTLAVTNTTTIKDVISGAFTLTKSGTGTLVLTGNNSFTGLLTLAGGTTILSGNNSAASGGVNLGANGGTLDVNSATALGTGTLSTGNNVTLDNTNASWSGIDTENNQLSFTNALTFAGTNSLNLGTGNVTLTGNTSITVSANTLTLGGSISGAFSLTKGGAGTLVLSGSSSNYTGGFVLGANTSTVAGTVDINSATALGTGTFVISGTGTSTIDNTLGSTVIDSQSNVQTWNANFTFAGSNALNMGQGNITLGATTVTVTTNASTLTEGGAIQTTTDGLTKAGLGTLLLTGTNLYTGATTVNGGVLQVGNGTSGSLAAGSALTMGGGTFYLKGTTSGASQTVASLTTTADTGSVITIDPDGQNNSNATTLTITSATIVDNAGSTLNFNLSDGTTNATSSTIGNTVVAWSAGATNGLIAGAGYTVTDDGGTGFATKSGSDVVRLTGQAALPTSASSSTGNYAVNNAYTTANGATGAGGLQEQLTASETIQTLAVDTTGLSSGATLALNGNTLTVGNKDGFVFNGANPYSISGGNLTFASTSAAYMVFNNYATAPVTIGASILANTGANSVTFAGPGTTVLSGTNTYTGATYVNGGTVEFANPASLYNSTTPTAANLVTSAGATTAFGVGGSGFTSPEIDALNTALITNATATSGFKNGSAIGFDTTGGNFTYNTVIANAAGGANTLGLVKLGTNALTLGGNNTYSGGTTVSAGTLYVNNSAGSGTGSGAVVVNSGGTLAGSGNITTSAGVTVKAGGTLSSGPAQASAPTVTGPGLTVTNTSVTVSGTGAGALSANLTFALGSGTDHLGSGTPGPNNFTNPITDTTYMTLSGSSTLNFTGTDSVSLVDLTAPTATTGATLSLRLGTPYLLVAAGSNSAYTGLITVSGTGANAVYSLDGTGYVVGVLVAGSGYTGGSTAPVLNTQYTPIAINEVAADGVSPLSANDFYPSPVLYLNAGDLEVVPEPGTWALMLGGVLVLVFWQRRRCQK